MDQQKKNLCRGQMRTMSVLSLLFIVKIYVGLINIVHCLGLENIMQKHLMALVKLMQNQEYFCIDAIKSIQKVLLHFFVNFVCLCIDGVGINSSE